MIISYEDEGFFLWTKSECSDLERDRKGGIWNSDAEPGSEAIELSDEVARLFLGQKQYKFIKENKECVDYLDWDGLGFVFDWEEILSCIPEEVLQKGIKNKPEDPSSLQEELNALKAENKKLQMQLDTVSKGLKTEQKVQDESKTYDIFASSI